VPLQQYSSLVPGQHQSKQPSRMREGIRHSYLVDDRDAPDGFAIMSDQKIQPPTLLGLSRAANLRCKG
jgi:hypothetical protein